MCSTPGSTTCRAPMWTWWATPTAFLNTSPVDSSTLSSPARCSSILCVHGSWWKRFRRCCARGGKAFIETHFSFSEHEAPWHFFQFNSRALEQLFHPRLGFRVIDSGLSSPIVGRFAKGSQGYLLDQPVNNLYGHSEIVVEKVGPADPAFSWRDVAQDLATTSSYPPPLASVPDTQ